MRERIQYNRNILYEKKNRNGNHWSAKKFELVLRWKTVSDTIKLTFMHGIQEVRKYGKIFWYGWIPR